MLAWFFVVAAAGRLFVVRTQLRSVVSEVGGDSASRRGVGIRGKSMRSLAAGLCVHPGDDKARMMLAKIRLRQQRRERSPRCYARFRKRARPGWKRSRFSASWRFASTERPRPSGFSGDWPSATQRHSSLASDCCTCSVCNNGRPRRGRCFWECIEFATTRAFLLDLVLELLVDQQDVRGLAPEMREFLAATPEDPFLRRAWGMGLLYQGRAPEALPHLEAAARLLENDPIGRFALAECRILLGKPVEIDAVDGTDAGAIE